MKRDAPESSNSLAQVLQEYYRAGEALRQGEDHFFTAIREACYDFFVREGLPTRKHERYRYTPLVERLTPFFAQGVECDHHGKVGEDVVLPPLLQGIDAYHVTLSHGRLIRPSASSAELPFRVYTLEEGYQRYPDVVSTHFHQQARSGEDSWVALNGALWRTGCMLYLPAQIELTKPIIVHHHIASDRPSAVHPRLLVVMGAHSSAAILETWTTSHVWTPAFVNSVGEMVLKRGSRLTYYPLQVVDAPAYQLRYRYVHQEEDSHFAHYLTAAAAQETMVRDEVHIQLEGSGAAAHLHGMYSSVGTQHLALHPVIHHRSPGTTTSQHYKGVGRGASTTLFDGHIHVAPQAQKTEASQHHKGWVVGERAAIYARPQLAIEADDVHCSHGTTTAQLDPNVVAYMQTRGISRLEAEKILLQAFFKEEIEAIPDQEIRKVVKKSVDALHR